VVVSHKIFLVRLFCAPLPAAPGGNCPPLPPSVTPLVCIALCTNVAHNIAQNRPNNFPSYPPDNHHWSDDVYLREGANVYIYRHIYVCCDLDSIL